MLDIKGIFPYNLTHETSTRLFQAHSGIAQR